MFGAKVLRGSPAVDKLLDKALAQDALAPADSCQREARQGLWSFDFLILPWSRLLPRLERA